jgi:hypothetical protein
LQLLATNTKIHSKMIEILNKYWIINSSLTILTSPFTWSITINWKTYHYNTLFFNGLHKKKIDE